MLLLTRRVGESIIIGDNIIIKVLKNRRGHLCLGIEAPREISIMRTELVATNHHTDTKPTSIQPTYSYDDALLY